MDSRIKPIFSGRNDSQASTLASFGKASLVGTGNYGASGNQTNNGSQPPIDYDVALKFYEGPNSSSSGKNFSNDTDKGLNSTAATLLNTQRADQAFQEGDRSQTDGFNNAKTTAQLLDSGKHFLSTANTLHSDDIDHSRATIKPHNPYQNHTGSSQLFAIKAQISRDLASTHRTLDNYPSPGQPSTHYGSKSYRVHGLASSMENPLAVSSIFSNPPQVTNRYTSSFSASPEKTGYSHSNYSTYSPDVQKLTILPEANPAAEKLDKAKRFQNELELRKELLIQMEERKKREEEAKRKNRLEEVMQEEKIKKEVSEFERVYGVKYEGLEARNLNLSLASELERERALKKKKDLFAALDTLKPYARKPTKKRPRTPIEEVERLLKLEKVDIKKVENPQQLIQKIPYAISKQINELVDQGLNPFRGEMQEEQKKLSLQVAALQTQARILEEEKRKRQVEVETLRMKLRQNEAIEAKKQAAIYTDIIKKQKDPISIYNTDTTVDPEVEEEIYSLSSKLKRKGYWNNLGKKREQEIDNEIRSSSNLYSLTYKGQILNPEELEYGYLNPKGVESRPKYSVFAKEGRRNGLEDPYGGGGYDMIPSQLQDDEVMNDAVNLLKKNKDRLKLLDEIEDPDVNKLGRIIDSVEFGNDSRYQNERNRDEGLEGLRNRYLGDYSDSLIEKISSVGGFYA